MSKKLIDISNKENNPNLMNMPTSKKHKTKDKVLKEVKKLEEIGKKGKLSKVISISIEFFDFFKSQMNEFSLRIIGYIIKGFFLSLNKEYLNFIRDIQRFIDERTHILFTEKKKKNSIGKKVENFTLQNFSLFNENKLFEEFLENSNMGELVHQTLQKINKNFSNVNFDKFTPEEKKEFLKKNFIKPLAQTCPITSNFFSSTIYHNNEEESNNENGKNFADYLNLDINDYINKDNFPVEDNYINNENLDFKLQSDEQLLNAKLQRKKNLCFLYDTKVIEIDIYNYLNEINNKNEYEGNEEIYRLNYRAIMKKVRLKRFKDSLNNEIFKIKKSNNFNDESNNWLTLEYTFNNLVNTISYDGFGNYNWKNIFEKKDDEYSIRGGDYDNNNLDISANKSAHSVLKYSIDSYKNFNNLNQFKDSYFLNLNSILKGREDVQNGIENIISKLKNYQDVSLHYICNQVNEQVDSIKELNEKEKYSIIFYNFLCTCQNKNIQMKQSEIYGNVFLCND